MYTNDSYRMLAPATLAGEESSNASTEPNSTNPSEAEIPAPVGTGGTSRV